MELAIGTDGRDALLLGGEACGGPVLDARTGAVLAVLGTALQAEHRSAPFAVALRTAAAADPGGPLAALLERNAATVPGYGPDLNLAGALELTATPWARPSPPTPASRWNDRVPRPHWRPSRTATARSWAWSEHPARAAPPHSRPWPYAAPTAPAPPRPSGSAARTSTPTTPPCPTR